MYVEEIGKTEVFPNNLCITYFLISTSRSIDEIKKLVDRGIAIFGIGALGNSLAALNTFGIKPAVLCNSNDEINGGHLFGYEMISTWDVISNYEQYYIIVPEIRDVIRSAIIRQMLYAGIKDFSLIKAVRLPDFERLGDMEPLKKSFMCSINKFAFPILIDKTIINDYFFNYMAGICWWHLIYKWVYETYKNKNNVKMLDIGPGIGFFSDCVKNLIDVNIDWIDLYVNNSYAYNVAENVMVMNIETNDVPSDKKYDFIVMTEVIEHFSYNPVPTLRKIRGLLKEEGFLFLSCPHNMQFYSHRTWRDMPTPGDEILFSYHDHIYEFSHRELLEICSEAGFIVVREGFSCVGKSNLMLSVSQIKKPN
ncbi:MAG: class I SAM-dependent methyltransferase [Fibromonadaceae bacterium]|jgi:2-polyprenyl-3-methyl-5-hydroxy-6-metoxy-1,4-benzoquinol methylase|nr:class I SAM-dependent methyltransferase [Fibromonadaceae bacterium]